MEDRPRHFNPEEMLEIRKDRNLRFAKHSEEPLEITP